MAEAIPIYKKFIELSIFLLAGSYLVLIFNYGLLVIGMYVGSGVNISGIIFLIGVFTGLMNLIMFIAQALIQRTFAIKKFMQGILLTILNPSILGYILAFVALTSN